MRPQSIQQGDDLSRHRAAILMPRQDDRDRIADRYRDERSGPVADAVLAVEIAIDFVGRDLLLREEVMVGDEARMIEGDGARQMGIAFAPSLFRKTGMSWSYSTELTALVYPSRTPNRKPPLPPTAAPSSPSSAGQSEGISPAS